MKRRRFLHLSGSCLAGSLLLPDWLRGADARADEVTLTILHTNDTHSRIDPFPMDGGPHEGLGGVARRATLVERVRESNPNVLLLDSGDIFQGTPYFNFFDGEIEFKAMSAMDYDVATLGNHDFDNGVEGLVDMLPYATFPFVSANYEVSGSALEGHVEPWIVKETGGVKVGIFGLGIAFEGLVLASLHEGVRYTDPFAAARRSVRALREEGCDLVVCLSHLGYRYRGDRPSDIRLAQEVEGIDLILGGHTHTFLDQPDVFTDPGGGQTLVNQVGWAGMRVGRIDVTMSPREDQVGPAEYRPRAWSSAAYPVDPALD